MTELRIRMDNDMLVRKGGRCQAKQVRLLTTRPHSIRACRPRTATW